MAVSQASKLPLDPQCEGADGCEPGFDAPGVEAGEEAAAAARLSISNLSFSACCKHKREIYILYML